MSMATMNPVAGGPVGGGMMMMNNGSSPAVNAGMNNHDPIKKNLNAYIYDYLLKHGHYDVARAAAQDSKFEFPQDTKSPGRRKNGEMNGDGGDMEMDFKDDAPTDLPRPNNWDGTDNTSFLIEWFSIFSDLFAAHRGSQKQGGTLNAAAAQYLIHEKNNQRMRETLQNQNINRPGMNPAMMAQMRANMNGKLPGQMTPQQMQQMQAKRQQMAMQQQMERAQQGDGEMNGVRPGTPGDSDAVGSPSKRPRIDNGGQQNFQQGMVPNGRPGGVPGGPNQGMMIQSGFNPQMNQQQFQRNGGMPPKGMQGMPNGMINMANASSPMMGGGMGQFPEGMQMDMYNQRNNMPGGQPMQAGAGAQSGNHALQDYQMQLMLLEQQNKKRLMMARQEQHENNPGAGGMPGVNMQPTGMSPSGSRTGTSPNPGEMKRTPGMGLPGSPSAAEPMAGRSPAAMGFINNMQGGDFGGQMFIKDQPMMGAGPQGMRPPTSNDINAMRQQGGQPGRFQGGQPMQQQGSQAGQQMGTPGQRSDMPPPQAPAGGAQQRNGNSPSNAQAPPTPSQTKKGNPKAKKNAAKDDNAGKRPNKKGSMAAANSDDTPATPQQPSTPITPNNPSMNTTNKGQPGMQNQHQQNQGMMNQQMQQNDMNQFSFGGDSGPGADPAFNLDFSTLENADVLENFDFDSFLNTSADDTFNFNADVELGTDFNMGQGD